MPDFTKYLDLGATFILGLGLVWAIVKISQIKKQPNGFNNQILNELKSLNINHLQELRNCIEEGNRQLINTIHDDNMRIISALGEIKGLLKK